MFVDCSIWGEKLLEARQKPKQIFFHPMFLCLLCELFSFFFYTGGRDDDDDCLYTISTHFLRKHWLCSQSFAITWDGRVIPLHIMEVIIVCCISSSEGNKCSLLVWQARACRRTKKKNKCMYKSIDQKDAGKLFCFQVPKLSSVPSFRTHLLFGLNFPFLSLPLLLRLPVLVL